MASHHCVRCGDRLEVDIVVDDVYKTETYNIYPCKVCSYADRIESHNMTLNKIWAFLERCRK